MGITGSMLTCPCTITINRWFEKYRIIAACTLGWSINVYQIFATLAMEYLTDHSGYEWALRFCGLLPMGVLPFTFLLGKVPVTSAAEETAGSKSDKTPVSIPKILLNSELPSGNSRKSSILASLAPVSMIGTPMAGSVSRLNKTPGPLSPGLVDETGTGSSALDLPISPTKFRKILLILNLIMVLLHYAGFSTCRQMIITYLDKKYAYYEGLEGQSNNLTADYQLTPEHRYWVISSFAIASVVVGILMILLSDRIVKWKITSGHFLAVGSFLRVFRDFLVNFHAI